jgi:hypothetical protein
VAQDSVKARESGGLNDPVWNASVVIATAFDPSTGERLFTSDDLAALNSKSAKAVMSVAEVGARLSGLTDEEEVEAGKDSPSIPDDDSSSS